MLKEDLVEAFRKHVADPGFATRITERLAKALPHSEVHAGLTTSVSVIVDLQVVSDGGLLVVEQPPT